MKKLIIALAIVAAAVFGGTALSQQSAEAAPLRLCNSNSVINCGAYSQAELNQRVKGDVAALYKHYGVSTNISGAKEGIVHPNGTVTVAGKVVATDVHSVGRTHIGDSKAITVGGTRFYERPASSGVQIPFEAFVFFNSDGTFKNAIMKACGNPAWGKPVPKPQPKPSYKCESLKVSQKSRTEFSFDAKYSVKNATHKQTVYVVKDASGKVVSRSTSKSFKTDKAGTYTVTAEVTFTANGKDYTVTNGCVAKFTVKELPPKEIQVCELKTKKIITIKETAFDSKKHSKNLADCDVKQIEVCDLTTKEIITIDEDAFDESKHSKNLGDCAPAPTPELPKTGFGAALGLVAGTSAIGSGAFYAVTARRLRKQR